MTFRTRRSFIVATAVGVTGCLGGSAADDGPASEKQASFPTGDRRRGSGPDGPESGDSDGPDDLSETNAQGEDWEPASGSPGDADVETTSVVSGLDIPWDLAFAGGDAFLTERPGGVLRFDESEVTDESGLSPGDAETVLAGGDLPDQAAPGEGGTLGIAVHPDYPDPPVVFVYYTVDTGELQNRVVRYDLEDGEMETIVGGIPGAEWHNGGRITVDPRLGDESDDPTSENDDEALWILTGDARNPALAQDTSSLAGQILRTTLDGDPHPENPTFGGERGLTYSVGHRNPQGIVFAPDGTTFFTEHGPHGRDEVTLLRAGANYGWDVARGGPGDAEYDAYGDHGAFTPPVLNTGSETAWAPSGAAFYDDGAIPAWENRMLVAGLVSQSLYVVTLTPDGSPSGIGGTRFDDSWLDGEYGATAHRLYDGEFGRLRHVEQGPDGSVYLLTSNRDGRASGAFPREADDRMIRIDPA